MDTLHLNSSAVWTRDAVQRTYQERWWIGTTGKRESRESLLSAHDDESNL